MGEKYKKDFDGWNSKKSSIDQSKKEIRFHEREIWWGHVGVNVGSEIDGKGEKFARPILIFRTFTKRLMWVIPLSSKKRSGTYFCEVQSILEDGVKRWALLNQLKLVDSKRLIYKVGTISKDDFAAIKKAVMNLMP